MMNVQMIILCEELRPVDATMKKLLPSNIHVYICTNTKLLQTGEIEMYLQCSKLHFALYPGNEHKR